MNRKDFFTKSCQCGIASFAGLLLLSNNTYSQNENGVAPDESEKLKYQIDFSRQRFSDFIKHLDGFLEKEERMQLYSKVGESCASSYESEILKGKGNLKGVLNEQLKQDWLKDYQINEETGEIKLIGQPRENCGCPLVQKGLTPAEFCNCSIGHMKKFYELILDKKIEVRLDGSILMGNESCCFTIKYS